jgi:2',3'-cyclic-nucleotide 2'-phosphodiesterase (5'-nucleotidase family)
MGSFPQVSGITYEFDTSVSYEKGEQYPSSTYYKPADPGSRISIADVNGKGFDLDGRYLIATTDFIAHGGDTYYCFAEAAQKSFRSTGYTVYEALRYYLEDECKGIVPDVYAQPQNRISVK